MRTLKSEWLSYQEDVVPVGASHEQRTETRRAFYAGAQGALALLRSRALTDHQMAQELLEFLAAVKRGEA